MTVAAPGHSRTLTGIVFSSNDLASELDDRARFALWNDLYTARYGSLLLSRSTDQPFNVRLAFAPFGDVGLGRFEGTIMRAARNARVIAADGTNDFCLLVNQGRSPMLARQYRRDTKLPPGAATLFSDTEPGELLGTDGMNAWHALVVPRRPLLELVGHAEDLLACAVDRDRPAMRHLQRYLTIVSEPSSTGNDPLLMEHINTTLIDLIGLALGAERDAAHIARGRGLRAARIAQIIAEIRTGFADPAFSPRVVAAKLGLTPRYIQELLSESGLGFTDRVLELRLQRARRLLADIRHDRMRVSEIAFLCGFNDISYFNRTFRHRFGCAPLQYRGGNRDYRPANT